MMKFGLVLVFAVEATGAFMWQSSMSGSSPAAFGVATKEKRRRSECFMAMQGRGNTVAITNTERIKKVGGGIPVIPSGNNLLFDPSKEGKVGTTEERIRQGVDYQMSSPINEYYAVRAAAAAAAAASQPLVSDVQPADPSALPDKVDADAMPKMDAQHWLEDIGVPVNTISPKKPVAAEVLGRLPLIGEDAPGDIQHIMLQLPPGFHYVEGQSISVIPPGIDAKTGKPYKPRLYSIASTRYGDVLSGNTVSLCVRRAVYTDPKTGIEDPSKKGVCSNFLCDAEQGQSVLVAGPVGKTMLLPPVEEQRDLIFVATGTGIAPFRAFMHRLLVEQTVDRHLYNGNIWLILGVPTTSGLLYSQEIQHMCEQHKDRLRVDYAISREMKNSIDGGKLYVQHVLAQEADTLMNKLDGGAHIYFCGLKGMMPGIISSLEQVCRARGLDFEAKQQQWKSQWHVEVY